MVTTILEGILVVKSTETADQDDICGLCGQPGADKVAHPIHWPGERIPNGRFVHEVCEDEECCRAHALLSDDERQRFLWSLR